MPATTTGTTTTFPFKPGIYTALLTTTDPSLTGDLSTRTLSDMITVSGNATSFKTQHGGGGCDDINVPAAVRFYFTSPSASGPSDPAPGTPVKGGLPPAGFYTQFWWSNPMHMELTSGNQTQIITASMSVPAEWSDWDGKPATDPLVTAAFTKATQNVQAVGLSFGGVCFFETGVTPTPDTFTNEQFSSTFSE